MQQNRSGLAIKQLQNIGGIRSPSFGIVLYIFMIPARVFAAISFEIYRGLRCLLLKGESDAANPLGASDTRAMSSANKIMKNLY